MIRFAVTGGLLVALTLGALTLHTPGAGALVAPGANTAFVVLGGIAGAVYLLAAWLVVRRPVPSGAFPVVLLVAVALRIPLVPFPPFLSSDVNRYVWDGRVQLAGVNPYRYVPADPALARLRDEAVYPHINRADYAPTIYPPAAQVIFAATDALWPSVTGMKAAMVGFEVLAVACLVGLLRAAWLPPARVLIYAWNPLPVWAFAGNGHIDAAAIGLICAALLLWVRHRDGWAGALLGAAVATKFLPAVIAPALWRRGRGWRLVAAAAAVVLGLYALYGGVGLRVFGFLHGYGAEEGLDTGAGLWLLAGLDRLGLDRLGLDRLGLDRLGLDRLGLDRLATLPPVSVPLYFAASLLVLSALGGWFAFVRRPEGAVAVCGAAGIMMAVVTFVISPHYPWYFTWLAAPCVLAPYRAMLWMSAAPILLYLNTNGDRFVWPSVVFAPTLLLALVDLYRPRRALGPIKEGT